jgi:ubiquitin carboxyl-terminal hydrolase 10
LFCAPFYDFLDQTAKRAVHSFKSETPLVDAMIMFLRDFKVIDSASSVEQLRLRLKTDELEQYGDPLTPEYVYDTIRRLPRFDNMKRGSQEDAEEFLGFLLAGLHDDCALVIKKGEAQAAQNGTAPKTERSNSRRRSQRSLAVSFGLNTRRLARSHPSPLSHTSPCSWISASHTSTTSRTR